MRHNPDFLFPDASSVREFVKAHPWATIVSHTSAGELIASHCPMILDDTREDIVLVSHLGRPDERLHELGKHPVLVLVQGANSYVSSSWYDDSPQVPTWNFQAVHLQGDVEILSAADNLEALDELVEHFEAGQEHPRYMRGTPEDAAYAERIAAGTVGFRFTATSITAKHKMSQDKPTATVRRVVSKLEGAESSLAHEVAQHMRFTHGGL